MVKKLEGIIDDIDEDDLPWLQKDITKAAKQQNREKLNGLAEKVIRLKRQRRELAKYLKFFDGLLSQIQTVQMTSLTNDATQSLLQCLESMPNMANYDERQSTMIEFQRQMGSLKMANESLGDMFNEDEEEAEDDNVSDAVKDIVDNALTNASFSILNKLPSVSVTLPRNNNTNNNNNNSIRVSTNPHNILQEIDKYTKT